MPQFPHQWLPRKLLEEQGSLSCQWVFAGTKIFTEPFFSDSLTSLWHLKENMGDSIRTPLSQLPTLAEQVTSVSPSALIFHVSRCGSTLLSQLLSIEHSNIVLSEVPFLDAVLRLPYNKQNTVSEETADEYFQAAVKLYGQVRSGNEKKLFIKTDSWHLLFYQQLRKLYPGIPFIILYRSPAEVVRSQNRHRGMQSVPGTIEPELFGFTDADITFDLDLYMSRVLEKYSAAIIQAAENDPHCYLFNYNQGFENILRDVMEITSLSYSEEYMQKVAERCQYHSKSPGEVYKEANHVEQHADFLQSCFTWYHKMEQKRLAQTAYSEK